MKDIYSLPDVVLTLEEKSIILERRITEEFVCLKDRQSPRAHFLGGALAATTRSQEAVEGEEKAMRLASLSEAHPAYKEGRSVGHNLFQWVTP